MPAHALSDADDGWEMMQRHFCGGRSHKVEKLDPNNPTARCYLNYACRTALRAHPTLGGLSEGAETFMVTYALDRKKACKLSFPAAVEP
jgi:hypothetical protein